MNGEGIPTGGAHPLASKGPAFMVDLSKCPFKCPNYGKEVDYETPTFPVSERASMEIVTLPHRLFLGDESDMESVYQAIMKIKNNIEELASL